jgi:hypothetical protein
MSTARLIRILTLLALLIAPLGMVGEHAAMAMPAASGGHAQTHAPAGHCGDMDGESRSRSSPNIDCMIACSAMHSADFVVDAHSAAPAPIEPGRLAPVPRGLNHAAEPPPPRPS